MEKHRLDIDLVKRGLFLSREKAVEAIKNKQVQVDGRVISKPSFLIDDSNNIVLGEQLLPYVSKGGLKLEKAIKTFQIDFTDKIVLDIGCSTGGFADCAIQHKARFVYGIDVGSNQLDDRLKDCPKLKYYEKLHIKNLSASHLDNKKIDIVTADISFISLEQIFVPTILNLHKNSILILLIKPQFELNESSLDKNGFVRNPKHHLTAIEKIIAAAQQHGLFLHKIDYAPLMTYKKNIEYITLFSFQESILPPLNNIINNAFIEKKKIK